MLHLIREYYTRFLAHRLYPDIFKSTSGRMISAAITFLKTILLVRLIAPSIYGEIAVLFSWGYIISAIFEVGAGSAFIALESKVAPDMQSHHFWQLMRARLTISLFVLGLAAGVILVYPNRNLIRLCAAIILGLGQVISHSPEFLFQSQNRFSRFSNFVILIATLQLGWTCLVILFYKMQIIGNILLWFLLAFSGWFAAVPLLHMNREVRHSWPISIQEDFHFLGKIISFGKWVALTGILSYLYQRWAVILLGGYGRPTDAAAYDVALNFSQVLNIMTLSAMNVLAPRFASLTDFTVIRRNFVKVMLIGGPIILISLLVYYIFGAQIVISFFGNEYVKSIVPLNALIPGFLCTLLTEPFVTFATFGLRRPDVVFWISLIKTIAFIMMGTWIMKTYGLLGLALIQSLAKILEHLLISLFALSRLRFYPTA